MSGNEMKFVETSNPIDLTTWDFADQFSVSTKQGYDLFDKWQTEWNNLFDKLRQALAQELTDVLRQEFKDYPPTLSFPFEWSSEGAIAGGGDGRGGPAPTDPCMIYVDLPLGKDDAACSFACSLEGAVDSVIDLYHSYPATRKVHEEGHEVCLKIAARLRELAAKLEQACEPDAKKPGASKA